MGILGYFLEHFRWIFRTFKSGQLSYHNYREITTVCAHTFHYHYYFNTTLHIITESL